MTSGRVTAERRRPDPAAALADDGQRRYRDSRFDTIAVKVLPGEHYVTGSPEEMLVTVLGSGVAACIRDPAIGVGGMNHFMLPESRDGQWGAASASLRYGNFAMETLINDILKQGGHRTRLEVKVFGGASIMGASAVGQSNGEFVLSYLKAEGLAVVAQDLWGEYPRRVHYFPATGKVHVLALHRRDELGAASEELMEKGIDGVAIKDDVLQDERHDQRGGDRGVAADAPLALADRQESERGHRQQHPIGVLHPHRLAA
jgi:chemotaxis protein CheD